MSERDDLHGMIIGDDLAKAIASYVEALCGMVRREGVPIE